MSNRRKPVHSSDPRRVPGGIAGPGGPHDVGGVVVDTRRAILLGECMVSTVDPERGGRGQQSAIAMMLSGRVNQTPEQVRVLFLFGTDGAAAIITELLGLLGRAGVDSDALLADITERMTKLHDEGNLDQA